MKTKSFIISLLVIFSYKAIAQNHHFIAHTGLGLVNSGGSFPDNSKATMGITAGITYEYESTTNWLYDVGLAYQQKGLKKEETIFDIYGDTEYNATLRLLHNYITIPLKLGHTFGNDTTQWYIHAGFVPSFLVGSSITNLDDNNKDFGEDVRVTKFELDGVLTTGLGFKLNENYQLRTSVSFQHSLMNYYDDIPWESLSDTTMKHYAFTLTLGLRYNLNMLKEN